jgi:hypothetical protein
VDVASNGVYFGADWSAKQSIMSTCAMLSSTPSEAGSKLRGDIICRVSVGDGTVGRKRSNVGEIAANISLCCIALELVARLGMCGCGSGDR